MRRWMLTLLALPLTLAAGTPTTSTSSTTLLPAPEPKSWVLVDVDTGAVLDQHDAHVLRRPASTVKLLTAVVAAASLGPDDDVPISALAAAAPPSKIGVLEGQTWRFQDLLSSLLASSANDAAVALAERVGGSLDGFSTQLQAAAETMGLRDHPVLADPAGLDDDTAHGDGDWISAWDLAVVGRAALAVPSIRATVAMPFVTFAGPDRAHRLTNHNKLLNHYDGAIGMKTGYTRPAGNTLVAAASRDGRTMLAVVLNAPDMYGAATALLDHGFATPVEQEPRSTLPPVRLPRAAAPLAVAGQALSTAPLPAPVDRQLVPPALIVTGAAAVLVSLRRRARRHAAPTP